MAGQLSADDRLRRLRRAGFLVLAALALAAAVVAALVARALLAPQARYVVRPELSVQGVVAGAVVRLNGVPVGRVARVGLWTEPVSRRARPEVVLALDAERDPALLGLRARVADGLRVEFVPVNPASGLLEVELAWAPGSPASSATADEDELPWLPSPQQQALNDLIPAVRRLAAEDLRGRVDRLVGGLASAEARVAGAPRLAADLASGAARLRAAADRLEQADASGRAVAAQAWLGEVREGLRAVTAAFDALDRELASGAGSSGETLRGFSAECRAAAARLRESLPPEERR